MKHARGVVWLTACTVASLALGRAALVARAQLPAPFDLISEGPHLTLAKALRAGYNLYDPSSYLRLPYTLVPYTPLYHLLVAWLPDDPANPFFTGRVVALVWMCAAAASLFVVVPRLDASPVALLALGLLFLNRAVTGNLAYVRCDSMALCCSAWAVVLLARVARRPSSVICPATLAAFAVISKQSFAAAGATGVLYLLARSVPLAAVFTATAATVAAVVGLGAWLHWGNGFWFCVTLPLTTYPRDFEAFFDHWTLMWNQPVFCFVVGFALLAFVLVAWRAPRTLRDSPYFLYMVLAWVVQTTVLTGVGASDHYLIEPVLATLLWGIAVIHRLGEERRFGWIGALALATLAVCVAKELAFADPRSYSYTNPTLTADYVRERSRIAGVLRARGVEHGRYLNLKNSQVAHDFDGEITVSDPYLLNVMWTTGASPTEPLLDAITSRYFDAVLVAPGLKSASGQTTDHPLQRIIRAVFQHYELAERGTVVNVLTRRSAAPPPDRRT